MVVSFGYFFCKRCFVYLGGLINVVGSSGRAILCFFCGWSS